MNSLVSLQVIWKTVLFCQIDVHIVHLLQLVLSTARTQPVLYLLHDEKDVLLLARTQKVIRLVEVVLLVLFFHYVLSPSGNPVLSAQKLLHNILPVAQGRLIVLEVQNVLEFLPVARLPQVIPVLSAQKLVHNNFPVSRGQVIIYYTKDVLQVLPAESPGHSQSSQGLEDR